jgi:hypothetical protein
MAVISVAGSAITFTVGATARSAQVTGGSVSVTPSIARTKTLTDTAYPLTDLEHSLSIDFVYDDETGLLGDLNTAAIAGTGLTIALVIGDTKWTGTMYVTDLGPSFSADGLTTSSASMIGTLALADQP